MKIQRHPIVSTIGPPAISPMTGHAGHDQGPPPHRLHAVVRGKRGMMSAIDVGPVAAPGIDPRTRMTISAAPLTRTPARMAKPAKPTR